MILVCGATGDLGGRVVRRLVEGGHAVRALVRPTTDAGDLVRLGVEVARGDLRDQASLHDALVGVGTVVSTANAIGRMLAGRTDLTIDAVDRHGNANLLRAAEQAGVARLVYVSIAGSEGMARLAPFAAAKWATEQALARSPLRTVVVRPDAFQEVWADKGPALDPAAGKAQIFGRGTTPHRYVATDDVAALVAHLAVAPDPPAVVEVGGPELTTPRELVALWEHATGRTFRVRRVPRPALSVAGRVLGRLRPELGSAMGMALWSDLHPPTWDDTPLREAGVEPRPVSTYVELSAARLAGSGAR